MLLICNIYLNTDITIKINQYFFLPQKEKFSYCL